jgi:ZIP family zinc transporter
MTATALDVTGAIERVATTAFAVDPGAIAFVFVAGLITAVATGLGALPFFLFDDISDRWNVVLWGVASGIMLAASGFGLLVEGFAASTGLPVLLGSGILAGVALVVVADAFLGRVDLSGYADAEPGPDPDPDPDARADGGTAEPEDGMETVVSTAVAEGNLRTLVLILGILTVHSFPEGVAIGVSFADLGLEGGVEVFGVAVPVLAVFMTVAISIHNVPEGVAVSIPLRSMNVGEWRMVAAAVFSSLPQPIGAVLAFVFVRWARAFLPFGFGFAAGAMIYLVLTEFIPEALEIGADLPGGGRRELAAGVVGGIAMMVPLLIV